jgi:hypothetical protein
MGNREHGHQVRVNLPLLYLKRKPGAMKPSQSRIVISLMLAVAASSMGGCGHDRQIVYTAPRSKPVQVDTSNGVDVQAPFVNVRVPARKPLPASNGVDVPIVEHD